MLFQFESDFAETLRCIPMQVRFKLDTCGVKLKLAHWNQLVYAERRQLIEQPCTTPDEIEHYRTTLRQLVEAHGGDRPADLPVAETPAWNDLTTLPDSVQAQAQSHGVSLTLDQWGSLTPLQRFALIKLSRSNHENHNFIPALKEFKLI